MTKAGGHERREAECPTGARPVDAPVQRVLETVAELLGADGAALWQAGAEDRTLVVTACVGVADAMCLAHPVMRTDRGGVIETLLQGKALAVAKFPPNFRLDGLSLHDGDFGLRALAAVPLPGGGKAAGTLMVLYSEHRELDQRDLTILSSYAKILRLVIDLDQERGERVAPQMAMLHTLTEVLEARDCYTAGHSNSVSKYAGLIARQMGLPPAEVETIERAAMLHDIGKIGVPDKVLLKPGALNAREWRTIRDHPTVGARILAPLAAFQEEVNLLLHHHERWDGHGYPDGAKGEEIPLGARILAVADVFNALVSARPYRSAHTVEEGVAILQKMAGVQLDPKVVESFLSLFGQ